MNKNTVATLAEMKARGEKISQLTCYDYTTARLIDEAGIDMILVGDSLGMTMQGYKDELQSAKQLYRRVSEAYMRMAEGKVKDIGSSKSQTDVNISM